MLPTFTTLVERGASVAELSSHLDSLETPRRIEEVCAIPARCLSPLFDRAQGAMPIRKEELVDAIDQTIVYALRNNLPLFSRSEKRFYRTRTGEIFGYNHTDAFATFFSGPGYFVVEEGEAGELVFDYEHLPFERPEGWPALRENRGVIAGITYGNMIDRVRGISRNTLIGAVFKRGRPRGAYFILTR